MTAIEDVFRSEWGRLLAALIHLLGDFDVAEEALQEAFAAAVTEWAGEVPRNPRAWLYGTARHKAIDRLRRRARFAEKQAEIAYLAPSMTSDNMEDADESGVPDERLRLIFTCCHPSLAEDAQVALTLRTLCGLSTEEIARAFLVPTATMAQRLVRAKAKIRGAGIPYRVPPASELPERLSVVMAVIYLVFNEGYAAASGAALVRHDLCAEAIRLARVLRALMPLAQLNAQLDALLALMLLHDARRLTRVDDNGEMVLLADQQRSRWDRAEIDEGRKLLHGSLRRSRPGTYALEAAIAAVHADALIAADTDWKQIAAIYERLYALHPTPIVALNHAVAVSMSDGPGAALPLVDALSDSLADYHLWHATRADVLRRLGRVEEAADSYRHAYELSGNEAERRFLMRRVRELARGT
ncbi:MAG: polymerase sigma-70 factor, subfamily [Thermoanaerobaculia bacterium]|nr:polymerase sigma-70 factor, subfamily [Thermoanaerobaculia bacterium]